MLTLPPFEVVVREGSRWSTPPRSPSRFTGTLMAAIRGPFGWEDYMWISATRSATR